MTASAGNRRCGIVAAAAAVVLALLGAAFTARADATMKFEGSNSDGSRVFFSTDERILPAADTDNFTDVYQRVDSTTSVVSFGAGNGLFHAKFEGSSTNGSHVFFSTRERLIPADTDTSGDVYERTGSSIALVSRGPGVAGEFTAEFAAASADGSRVIFVTPERLAPGDTDSTSDLYARQGGTTTLLTTGTTNGVVFGAASSDASRVFFISQDKLTSADTDSAADVYENASGTVSLVSIGEGGRGNGAADASFATVSRDGMRVYFESSESLVASDTDIANDVYQRAGGVTTLVSTSATAGNGTEDAAFRGASDDGTHVNFSTPEQMVPADGDGLEDIYDRNAGSTDLVSTGPQSSNGTFFLKFNAASADGSRVLFTTDEPLVPGDLDSNQDIYERSGDATTLVSVGPQEGTPADVFFDRASPDGTRVLFTTSESLVATDSDSASDVYERSGETTTLVSTDEGLPTVEADAQLAGATADLSVAFILTTEHLTEDDEDGGADSDIFSRAGVETKLISGGGGSGSNSLNPPINLATDPAQASSRLDPLVLGLAPPDTTVRVYLTADCSGEPAGAGTAAEFASPGIQIAVPPNAESPIRAAATDAEGSTSPCSAPVLYRHDSIAPNPPSLTATDPESPSNSTTPRVIGASEPNSMVRVYSTADCSGSFVSGSAGLLASQGVPVTVPQNQTTTFTAIAIDLAGNPSTCSAPISFVQDSTIASIPTLTVTNPASPANDNTVGIRGTADAGNKIRIYAGTDCSGTPVATGTAAALASAAGIPVEVNDNSKTNFRATAQTPAGNVSPCSAAVSYTEDSLAPNAPKLTPGSRVFSSDNRFVVKGSAETGTMITLFRGATCTPGEGFKTVSPEALRAGITLTVADNNTTMKVHAVAVDTARNVSKCTPDPLTYTEDSRAPNTRLTFGPAFKTRDRTPTFRFTDDTGDVTSRFECKIDKKAWRACKSPKTFRKLRRGRHVLRVRAVDAAGNRELKPVVKKFRVVR